MAFTFQINNDVVWDYDKNLLDRAEANIPRLIETEIHPIGIVERISEKQRVNDFELIKSDKNSLSLSDYSLGRGESLILDLGDHYVGQFSIDIASVGSPMDAPFIFTIEIC